MDSLLSLCKCPGFPGLRDLLVQVSLHTCVYIYVYTYTHTHTHTYLNTHIYIVQNKKCFIEHTVLMLKIWALLPELDSSSGLDKGNPNTAEP